MKAAAAMKEEGNDGDDGAGHDSQSESVYDSFPGGGEESVSLGSVVDKFGPDFSIT